MFKLFTRSSQIGFHNIRMYTQVVKKYFKWFCIFSLLTFALLMFLLSNKYELFGWWAVIKSAVYIKFNKPDDIINTIVSNGHIQGAYQYTAQAIYNNTGYFGHKYRSFNQHIGWSIIISFSFWLMAFALFIWRLKKFGKRLTTDELVRGRTLEDVKAVNQKLKEENRKSDFKLGDLHMVDGSETRHILLHGTTGVGKTVVCKQIIRQFRTKNQRGLIFDEGGAYVEEFYDEKRGDVILSPFDARCVAWSLYDECDTQTEFENFAAALIPSESDKDPFWITSARNVVASIAYSLKQANKTTYKELLKHCLNIRLEDLQVMLKGTPAEMLVDGDIAKTATTIRAVITNHIKALRYLPEIDDSKRKFSLREWVLNEEAHKGACAFIIVRDKEIEASRSLISLWIGLFTTHVKSMPRVTASNHHAERRIWLMLDELTKLNNIVSLTDTLQTGRNYGLCCVLGFQNKPLMRTVYGKDRTDAIIDLLSTQVFYRSPTYTVAKDVSYDLGECEVIESTENQSYGADTVRDGININHNKRTKYVVSYTEIQKLDDLECYIKLPANLPIVKLKIPRPTKSIQNNVGFTERKITTDNNIEKRLERIAAETRVQLNTDHIIAHALSGGNSDLFATSSASFTDNGTESENTEDSKTDNKTEFERPLKKEVEANFLHSTEDGESDKQILDHTIALEESQTQHQNNLTEQQNNQQSDRHHSKDDEDIIL